MTTVGRRTARHELYPSDYIPKRVTQWQLFREWCGGMYLDCVTHWWFWGLVVSAFVWLSYIFAKWAVSVPGAMRIGQ